MYMQVPRSFARIIQHIMNHESESIIYDLCTIIHTRARGHIAAAIHARGTLCPLIAHVPNVYIYIVYRARGRRRKR
jgi:hypothetical protein